jgi:putative hemolysin
MVAIPAGATVREAMDLMLDEGHLRVPVYEGDLDHVVGVLAARDLWRAARAGESLITPAVRPVPFAPESKPVEGLITEMREQRVKMAIVVDEFGGTAGLVTLEDLIEEIIGDIRDEHEPDEPTDFLEMENGEVQVRGDALVREMNEFLSLELPEAEADTVGGFVFGRLGRVPQTGDEVSVKEGVFRVTRVRGRRIVLVTFSPPPTRP